MGRSSIRRRRASVAGALFARGGSEYREREGLLRLCWTISTASGAPRWWLHKARALETLYGGGLWEVWCALAKIPHHELYRLVARYGSNRKKAERSFGRRGARRVQGHLGKPKANPYVGLVRAPRTIRAGAEDRGDLQEVQS